MSDLVHDENEASLLRPTLIRLGRDMAEILPINQSINQSLNTIETGSLCVQRGVIILDTKFYPRDMMKMVKLCKGLIYT